MQKHVLVLSAGLALLTGCPLLDVEVEVPEVCVAYHELEVEGLPIDGEQAVHRSFVVDDLSALHRITDLDADVSFVRAELFALSGVDDFGFVESARITLSHADLPPLVLYQCDGDCVAADGSLDMTPAARHDALAYLRGDTVTVDIELTGAVPSDPWSMSVDVCFQARARYTY